MVNLRRVFLGGALIIALAACQGDGENDAATVPSLTPPRSSGVVPVTGTSQAEPAKPVAAPAYPGETSGTAGITANGTTTAGAAGGAPGGSTGNQPSGSSGAGADAGSLPADGGVSSTSKGLEGDMLNAGELKRARDLALASDAVQSVVAMAADRDTVLAAEGRSAARDGGLAALLADRPTYRVLYTQRAPEKGASTRMAEVGIYRYDTAKPSISQVDLASGKVTAMDVPPDYPMPVVREEIDEAATVARQNDDVRSALTAAGLDPDTAPANGIMTGTQDASSPCAAHRCLRLSFTSQEKPVPTFTVIVDLVSLKVVLVDQMNGQVSGQADRQSGGQSGSPSSGQSNSPSNDQSNSPTNGQSSSQLKSGRPTP